MNTISALPAAPSPIGDSVQVTVDWEAEPVNWDDAVAWKAKMSEQRSAVDLVLEGMAR